MPSIINSTTTNGVVIQPDNSGSLALQTNSGTTAVTIDTSQNVGIGTTSPTGKLDVRVTGDGNRTVNLFNTTQALGFRIRTSGTDNFIEAVNTAEDAYTSGRIVAGPLSLESATFTKFNTNGTERMRIDSSGNLLFNSGYGSVATAYGCRAWVNFNGTGTVAIRASGNVTSITDGGVGNYTVNMTTAMPDTNYAVAITASGESRANSARIGTIATTGSTSAFVVDIYNPAAAAFQDPAIVMVEVFR